MARDKLKDFLNGKSTENRIAYTVDPTDVGPTDRFNEGDDLGVDPGTNEELLGLKNPETTGGLLGDFLKYMIDISDNQFTLKGGNQPGFTTNRGDYLTPLNQQGVEESFTEALDRIRSEAPGGSKGETLATVMSSYSKSGYLNKQIISDDIDKTGFNSVPVQAESQDGPRSGQTALGTIVGQNISHQGRSDQGVVPTESRLQDAVEDMLVARSRFRNVSGDRFESFVDSNDKSAESFEVGIDLDSDGVPDRESGTISYQRNFGEYLVDPGSDPGGTDPVHLAQLMSVGESLLLKSAGWDNSGTPGESANPDDIVADTAARKLSEGDFTGGESAFKVDNDSLRARNASGAPEDAVGSSVYAGRGTFLTEEGGGKSFGTTTTPKSLFTESTSQVILRAQAAAAIAAMISISELTFDVMDTAGGGDTMLDLGRGPFVAGQSKRVAREAKLQLLRNMVLAPTEYDYKRCVKQGFLILFNRGFSDGENDLGKTAGYQAIQEASGFWLSVAKKILISYATVLSAVGSEESFTSPTASNVSSIFMGLSNTPLLKILNVAAIIGNVSIKSMGGRDGEPNPNEPVGPWNVDRLPDGPATRISKSRTQNGQTASALAWRTSATPAIYTIPRNVIMAAVNMGTLGDGTNPLKGMMGSQLIKKTYLDVNAGGGSSALGGTGEARIPNDIVERLENLLDAEYVPFYFHDLRTNEIISFHAFIESLSDRFRPDWTRTTGYGRVDSVQTYRTTTRSLSFEFYIASTSKEDFDEMWWKINKLTTLVYPQWTKGTLMSTGEGDKKSTFVQPFSQVLGASPIIRLRIGDVIKGNYSKFNLARMFGIGDSDVKPKAQTEVPGAAFLSEVAQAAIDATEGQMDTVFAAIYGSPLAWGGNMGGVRALRAFASQVLINGFANPLGVSLVMRELQSPDSQINAESFSLTAAGAIQAGASALKAGMGSITGWTPMTFPYLKASVDNGYVLEEGGTRWRILRPLRVIVLGFKRDTEIIATKQDANSSASMKGPKRKANPLIKTYYRVAIIDLNAPFNILGKTFVVTHADLMPNVNAIFNSYVLPLLSIGGVIDAAAQALANEAATLTGIPSDQLNLAISDAANFMRATDGVDGGATVNPVVKAFESTSGRGLAGVITDLSYTLIDSNNTWEIDWNSRAPKVVKVNIGFEVIHDLPPGLDHNGYNRAPLYNVGDIMRYVAGDPYADDGHGSHDSYKNQGRLGTVSENPTDTSAILNSEKDRKE